MRALVFAVALAASSAACLRTTEFHCTSSAECSATGAVCETTGYCSFVDTGCAGGRRYGDLSGPVAGQCVGSSMMADAGVDSPMTDSGHMCPSTYTALGSSAHRYRVIGATASWSTQKAACAADGAGIYLAVPDDQAELTAMIAKVAAARVWFGINDPASNDMFVTTNGGTFPTNSPLWGTGEPNSAAEGGGGSGPADCVMGESSNNRLFDDSCMGGSHVYPAICECEP